MTNPMPPGWYVDPSNPAFEHWWDGTRYTQSRARAVTAAYPQPSNVALPGAGTSISSKSRMAATLLGFFLGGLGIDRFYLGNTGMGVAKLLVGWATLGIWPLVDWIVIVSGNAHDGAGLPVTSWD